MIWSLGQSYAWTIPTYDKFSGQPIVRPTKFCSVLPKDLEDRLQRFQWRSVPSAIPL